MKDDDAEALAVAGEAMLHSLSEYFRQTGAGPTFNASPEWTSGRDALVAALADYRRDHLRPVRTVDGVAQDGNDHRTKGARRSHGAPHVIDLHVKIERETERQAAADFVLDRGDQFVPSSGYRDFARQCAAGILDGTARERADAGEFDDVPEPPRTRKAWRTIGDVPDREWRMYAELQAPPLCVVIVPWPKPNEGSDTLVLSTAVKPRVDPAARICILPKGES